MLNHSGLEDCYYKKNDAVTKFVSEMSNLRKAQGNEKRKYIKVMWTNLIGIRYYRMWMIPNNENDLKHLCFNGVNTTKALAGLPAYADVCGDFMPKSFYSDDWRLIPGVNFDFQQIDLTACPYNDRVFHIFGDLMDRFSAKKNAQNNITSLPDEFCTRSVLRNFLEKVRTDQEFMMSFEIGFEIEFQLVYDPLTVTPNQKKYCKDFCSSTNENLFPVQHGNYCIANDFHNTLVSETLFDIVDALGEGGVDIEHFHSEAAQGQYEVVLRHKDPLKACDSVVLAYDIIKGVAEKHGLKAVFIPKTSMSAAGNSTHCHFSVIKDGKNLFNTMKIDYEKNDKYGNPIQYIDPIVSQFLAGVLNNYKLIQKFTAGSLNSLLRTAEGCWAGMFNTWGILNKESILRICQEWSDSTITNTEWKLFDCTANPYLGVLMILASGLEGVSKSLPLSEKQYCNIDPAKLDVSERQERGIKAVCTEWAEFQEIQMSDFMKKWTISELAYKSYTGQRDMDWEHAQRNGEISKKTVAENPELMKKLAEDVQFLY